MKLSDIMPLASTISSETLDNEITSEQLFLKVKDEGSYKAFEKLYYRFYKPLINYAHKYMKSIQVSDDMVSEVFYKIWKRRKEITVSSSFQSYLFTAVRNKCLDHLRAENKVHHCDDDILVEFDSLTATPLQYTMGEELQNRIEMAIEALPKDRKRIFRMSRDNGMKYKEIAEMLGISIKTVETQMGRALKHLRTALKEFM